MRLALGILTTLLALPAGPAGALTVDEVLARYVEARGGIAKLAAIKSLRATGKAVFGGGEFAIEAAWVRLQKRPGMMRTETKRSRGCLPEEKPPSSFVQHPVSL